MCAAALAYTDPTQRVHRAYNAVRKSQRADHLLQPMHALYERVCSTENLTDADDMLLQRVELAIDSDNWSHRTQCNSMHSKRPQLRLVPTAPNV